MVDVTANGISFVSMMDLLSTPDLGKTFSEAGSYKSAFLKEYDTRLKFLTERSTSDTSTSGKGATNAPNRADTFEALLGRASSSLLTDLKDAKDPEAPEVEDDVVVSNSESDDNAATDEADTADSADTDEAATDSAAADEPAPGSADTSGIDPGNEEVDSEGLNDAIRAEMVKLANEYGDGFGEFSDTKIANATSDNPLWENDGDSMKVRDGVKPSDAVNDMFENPDGYEFECASSVVALSMKAQLNVLGEERFNEVYEDGLTLNGWSDSAISGAEVDRRAEAGTEILGTETVEGDLAPFSAAEGDTLIEGDIYYFDKPGDAETEFQGWNTVYLGKGDGEKDRFWTMEGIEEFTLKDVDGALAPDESADILDGYYLGASRTDPNGGFFAEDESDPPSTPDA